MDGGAWWAAVHGVAKSRTRLSDFTFTFHFHALEKEMATHSRVLAWRIPGTGEPGGLPPMGSDTTEVMTEVMQQQQLLNLCLLAECFLFGALSMFDSESLLDLLLNIIIVTIILFSSVA